MNDYNELKLAVYESSLDWDEKNEVIDIMESCDEDEFQDICESVELFLEKVDAAKKNALKDAVADNSDWIGLSLGSAGTVAANLVEFNMYKKALKNEEARLEKFKKMNAKCEDEEDKKFYEDQIRQGEKSVSNLKKAISRTKVNTGITAAIAAGTTAYTAHNTRKDYKANKEKNYARERNTK